MENINVLCVFDKIDSNMFICQNCGYKTSFANLERNCIKLDNGPSNFRRLANFAYAAVKHELTGRKTVSDEVLKSRLSICTNCPSNLFKRIDENTGICTHETCGCNIKDYQTYLNKIAWSDQECPVGHWKAVSQDNNKDNNVEKD